MRRVFYGVCEGGPMHTTTLTAPTRSFSSRGNPTGYYVFDERPRGRSAWVWTTRPPIDRDVVVFEGSW